MKDEIQMREAKLEELKRINKEKEQENRITMLKIKEMKRLLKHKQLKPLGTSDTHNKEEISNT